MTFKIDFFYIIVISSLTGNVSVVKEMLHMTNYFRFFLFKKKYSSIKRAFYDRILSFKISLQLQPTSVQSLQLWTEFFEHRVLIQ